ncbi:biotin transporter BioY [Caldinitratiruptor microaerophilus]|uniref:Biotin transporter n=1 Tax=Caldinitratiruptor microaerophilus TaxID=671077 RepID=A0AA35CJC2_9FIRM|nr:biotin transporter BioY [Caldinitratiruptor microaerophilus]BDG60359.1 biotin transporter BioY [Caldinitratiruptor microaerophilus]
MSSAQSSRTVRQVVLAGLFAAVVAALGMVPPLTLPISPVPITLQTLGVMLAGSLLGRRTGGLALLVFLVLLVAGVPVLAGGRGGAGYLFGPSGGYILSWPLAAYTIGWLVERVPPGRFWGYLVANVVGGILLVYLIGAPVLALVTGRTFKEALVGGALIFVPGDLLKALVASAVAVQVRRRYAPGRAEDRAA